MKKILLVLSIILTFTTIYAQEAEATAENNSDDKYTVNNYMITKVFQCSEGLIINYLDAQKSQDIKIMHIPNKFFREKKAFRYNENSGKIAPQMNVVLKNSQPFKVKLYLHNNKSDSTYRFLDVIPNDLVENFNIDEIEIAL